MDFYFQTGTITKTLPINLKIKILNKSFIDYFVNLSDEINKNKRKIRGGLDLGKKIKTKTKMVKKSNNKQLRIYVLIFLI